MQQQRTSNRVNLSRFVALCMLGLLLTPNSTTDMNDATASAFVSSSPVNGDASTRSGGRGQSGMTSSDYTSDAQDETVAQTTASTVVSEIGEIAQSTETASVPLLLPSNDESNENITSIKLGETISFAELGPIILNTDGTTRRIDNWNTLTKQEQETTWRRIKKRNAQRREQLLLLQRQQEIEQEEMEKEEDQSNFSSSG